MSKQLFTNHAKGKLNASILNTDLALSVQAGQGALYPNPTLGNYFRFTLIDSSGNKEICYCTQRTGDTFNTILRGQEGTTPRGFSSSDKVECRWTAGNAANADQRPNIQTLAGNTTLTYGDVNDLKIITGGGNYDLPAASAVDLGDWIEFKSTTTGNVQLRPNGTDTIDGVNANYQLPSFCVCRAMKTAAGAWTLVKRPNVHVGQTIVSSSATAPQGTLPEDGTAVSRTTYAGLFAAQGTAFGVGDGATTFNVPDSQGRVDIGTGAGAALTVRALGDKGGAESHTLTEAETPLKAHVHAGGRDASAPGAGPGWGGTVVGTLSNYTNTASADDATATPHATISPFVAKKKYVKT